MSLPSASSDDAALIAERQAAARLLLAHPLITAHGRYADTFPLVRRHAEWLSQRFQQVLGYQLLVESGYARLFKAGLGTGAGRRLERANGKPFTPRDYACLALALSVLVTAPEQLLLSRLLGDIRAAAVDAGVDLGDAGRQQEKRTLVAALRQLIDWSVLQETDGSVELALDAAESREALLTVDRDIARAIVAVPLGQSSSAADLIHRAADPGFGGPRTYVRRQLLETPAVLLDELTDSEREWLRTRQRREAQAFSELLGLEAEIRAEGVLMVDPSDELTDLQLPGTKTVAHCALLLVGLLVERLRPEEAGHPSTGGQLTIGVPIPPGLVSELVEGLLAEHERRAGWQRYREDPDALAREALDLLRRMRLVVPAGVPLRSQGCGVPEGYADEAPQDRAVTDVRATRERPARTVADPGALEQRWPEPESLEGVGSLVLLAPAARYAVRAAGPRRTTTVPASAAASERPTAEPPEPTQETTLW